jgi:D-apionolactonase
MSVDLELRQRRISREMLLSGGALPDKGIPLRAGPLTMTFQDGGLRYIRLGDHEIIRRIYCAVRGPDWETVPERRLGVSSSIGRDSFCIEFYVENVQYEIDFHWTGTIRGQTDGRVVFEINGVARSTFLKNRIGMCVLHPVRECAGVPCRIRQVNGDAIESAFPRSIAARNPFCDVVSIAHLVAPNLWAEMEFDGDVFEMEDQRNWTDASFKTFCTPLRLPYPVEIKEGQRIRQRVTLFLNGSAPKSSNGPSVNPRSTTRPSNGPTELIFTSEPPRQLPQIGLDMASHRRKLVAEELRRLKHLSLSHLRVELHLAENEHRALLREANKEALEIGAPLELALFLSNNAESELADLVRQLYDLRPQVIRCSIFHRDMETADDELVDLSREYLTSFDQAIQMGWGTWANFAELNRSGRPTKRIDYVTYSLHPQEHAFDNMSLVETLPSQAATVENAKGRFGQVTVVVGPITLKKRVNQNASVAPRKPPLEELSKRADERQVALFGAVWTLGSVKYLAESGVHSATYYETTGCLGIMSSKNSLPMPEHCLPLEGCVFPAYHVFADLGELANGTVLPIQSSNPLCVDGIAVSNFRTMSIILANMTADQQTVSIPACGTNRRVRLLDESNAIAAMSTPDSYRSSHWKAFPSNGSRITLELRPYCLARVDMLRD